MVEIWKRKVSPTSDKYFSFAVLFINKQTDKKAVIRFSLCRLGMCYKQRYDITELFFGESFGEVRGNESVKVTVHPMDAALIHCKILK